MKRSTVVLLGIAFLSWYITDSLSFDLSVVLVLFYFAASLFFAYRAFFGIFPSMRLLLLAGPGILACMVYWLTDGKMYVIYYTGEWLTPTFVREFAMSSAVAGLASVVGHTFAARSMPAPLDMPFYKASRSEIRAVTWVGLTVSALMLWALVYEAGDYLYKTGSYTESIGGNKGKPLMGVFNSAGVFFLLVSFMALHYRDGRMRRLNLLWMTLALVFLMNLALRGLRQDAFPVVGIILFFSWLLPRRRLPARSIFYALLILIVGYFLGIFTGRLRMDFSWATLKNS